jgi:quercetin dioxygenase-like cupin family protein
MPEYAYIANLAAQVPDVPADSILSRSVYSDERVKVSVFAFAPGQELSEHTASMPAIIHILEGEATLTLGGDTHPAGAGTWVRMPAQLPHGVLAKTPVRMLLIMLPGG